MFGFMPNMRSISTEYLGLGSIRYTHYGNRHVLLASWAQLWEATERARLSDLELEQMRADRAEGELAEGEGLVGGQSWGVVVPL